MQMMIDLVDAVRYLHDEVKVAHRSIHPSNVLISDKGCVKLSDMCLSRAASGSSRIHSGVL